MHSEWTDPKIWTALIGVVIGFGLNWSVGWYRRRRENRARFAALNAELGACRRMAQSYLDENVIAPSYRLPMNAYRHSFPGLLGSGVPADQGDIEAITDYFSQVETFNRGLDQTQSWVGTDAERLHREHSRNRLKAAQLVAGGNAATTLHDRAAVVFKRHLGDAA